VDLSDYFSHDIALSTVVAHDISVANGEKQVLAVSPPIQGFVTGPAVPNNVALVVSHKTAKTGRSFMGRTYLAGADIASLTDNSIGAARAANIVAQFNTLITALGTINAELVVASFVSGGVPRAMGVATPVDSTAMNLRVDTQRRRLPD